jgi:hypothetical protein
MNEHTTPPPRPKTGATGPVGEPPPTPRVAGESPAQPIVQEAEQAPPDLPSEVKVKLRKPIATHFSPTTDSLTFREPTAMDIDQVGNPVSNDFSRGWPPMPVIDSKKMTFMMARLANISPNDILKHMTARDWSTCSLAVQVFFLPDLGNL